MYGGTPVRGDNCLGGQMSGGTNVLGGQLSWGDTCPGGQMSGDTSPGGHLSRGTNVGGTVVGGTNVTPPPLLHVTLLIKGVSRIIQGSLKDISNVHLRIFQGSC